MAVQNQADLTALLNQNITDPQNRQNTAARVRAVLQDIIDTLFDGDLSAADVNTLITNALASYLTTAAASATYRTSAQVSTAISTALASYLTTAQINARGYQNATQVASAISTALGSYLTETEIQALDYQTASDVLSLIRSNRNPDSFVNARVNSEQLIFRRQSDTNELQVNLPIGFGEAFVGGYEFTSATSDGNWTDVIIPTPDNPDDDDLFVVYAQWNTYPAEIGVVTGKQIKALSTLTVGGSTGGLLIMTDPADGTRLYLAKNTGDNLIIRTNAGPFQADNYFTLFKKTDEEASTPNPLTRGRGPVFYERQAFSAATDVSSDATVLATGYEETLLAATATRDKFVAGLDIDTRFHGQLEVDYNWPSNEVRTIRYEIHTTYIFGSKELEFVHSILEVASKNQHHFVLNSADYVDVLRIGANRPTDGNSDGSQDVTLTAADLAGPTSIKFDLFIFGLRANGQVHDNWTIESLVFQDAEVIISQQQHAAAVPAAASPYVTEFTVTGELTPAAGDIGGNTYNYSTAISHADEVSAVRGIGYESSTPGTVAVLFTLTADQFAHHTGSFTIPGTVNLTAGSTYVVELQVYGEGQTVGTDTPITHSLRRITAHAATTQVRFIRVPYRVGGARPTAANLIANSTVISSAGTVIGTWAVSGIPNDSVNYLLGWIVPQSGTQPTRYTIGGIDNTGDIATRFALTESSTDFWVYLFSDDSRIDDLFNGSTIVVS